MSTLQRLFAYASAPTNRPLENFFTEVLAAAIQDTPPPFFSALGVPCPDPASLDVDTQQRFDVGQPDLVIRRNGVIAWVVEVKVDAGPTGNQLANYAQIPGASVVFLTPHGQPTDGAAGLAWSAIHREARGSEDTWWKELLEFMEWHGMADAGVTTRAELATAQGVSRLMKRFIRGIQPVLAGLRAKGFGSWPSDGRLAAHIAERFLRDGDEAGAISVEGSPGPGLGLCLGLRPTDASAALEACAWIWRDTRRDPHDAIGAIVRGAQLGDSWRAVGHDWVLLERSEPEIVGWTAKNLESWFQDRVDELTNAGVLQAVLPRISAADAGTWSSRESPGSRHRSSVSPTI